MTHATNADKPLLLAWIRDALRRTVVHYGLWFAESIHQHGLQAALDAEAEAGDRAWDILAARLGKTLGFEVKDGLPAALEAMDTAQLAQVLDALCVNWLAVDGVWFQAVEGRFGIADAKRVNDTCWSRFSPFEAVRIKSLLGLPEAGGLDALQAALEHRLYTRINVQELDRESESSLVLRMVECRVQAARRRKGLELYPCGSGGLVEYREFARTVDPRIAVTCLGCPPDSPEEWYCSWRFHIP